MTRPRGLLEREEILLLVVILSGIVLLSALFVVFGSTSELVSAPNGAQIAPTST